MPHYRIVDETNPERHIIASFALRLAAAELKIEEPKLCFVQPTIGAIADLETRESVAGLTRGAGKEIFIRVGLSHKDLAATIFHELRHCWQIRHGLEFSPSRERAADVFALQMMVKLGDPPEFRVLEFLIRAAKGFENAKNIK